MKSNKIVAKKEEKPKYQRPKLSGSIELKAKNGKMLPLRYIGTDLVRVRENKWLALDWGSLPYDSKNMVHRALETGDVELKK